MSSDASHLRLLADKLARDLGRDAAEPSARPATEPDDETLLVRVQAEDMDALALLFHRYSKLMLGIARRILQDNNEAEDLVQDVFLFLFYKGKTFNPAKGLARSWLMQVTYHRAFDRRRYLNARSFYDRTGEPSDTSATLPPQAGDNPRFGFGFLCVLGGDRHRFYRSRDRFHSFFPPTLAVNVLGHINIGVAHVVPDDLRPCTLAHIHWWGICEHLLKCDDESLHVFHATQRFRQQVKAYVRNTGSTSNGPVRSAWSIAGKTIAPILRCCGEGFISNLVN